MFFGVCVLCRISFSIVSGLDVSCSGSVTSVEEERAFLLLSFTSNCVDSVWRDFFFFFVL